MNNYIIMFLISAYTFNSYSMHKEQKTIVPHCNTQHTTSTTNEVKDKHETEKEISDGVIDRQIVLYHYTHDIKPPYPTPINWAFAEKVIREYENGKIKKE